MLHEVEKVRQYPEEGFRRWFTDRSMDFIVWYEDETQQQINGFQICYDKMDNEHALTWYRESGFSHNKIDDGEVPFSTKMSPVLVADGLPPYQKIFSLFQGVAGDVDKDLRDFVEAKLQAMSS